MPLFEAVFFPFVGCTLEEPLFKVMMGAAHSDSLNFLRRFNAVEEKEYEKINRLTIVHI